MMKVRRITFTSSAMKSHMFRAIPLTVRLAKGLARDQRPNERSDRSDVRAYNKEQCKKV
ncbi:hypothetical protein GUITHDRAFT_149959 [Guillardia theta CCMP2712]|uniref:Uncharacterized protein n=1 Tax=Guillardia theta (strain CCMP2712) TaxID=905079 RepID=L1K405_GUITC|nr:hypothetical protein GUITHDRAFT_149959 [Guillardia theta CCMP2712]EKX55103.1 hypothetical protein GUITHDRAFT_149959 [Guillardia theta CCMP2712]|eukprot:XP_005842083.1 hypothetical protein GUITHDRAFT_149959 [Guillardia theta CCMP2712]